MFEKSGMEILLNVTGIFENNSSFNVTDTPSGEPYRNTNIDRNINLTVIPILIVFGTIGNLLSFYVMRKSSLKKVSTCFYMSMLALADTGEYFSQFNLFNLFRVLLPSCMATP